MKTSWRITPPPNMATELRRMALSEGRSDSAMLLRLIDEALTARRKADAAVDTLITTLRGLSDVA
jgi:hypothetical protein